MLILDIQDDQGALIASMLGDDEPGEIIKTAAHLPADELLDRDFALILIDDTGHEHRKYACHDAGNILVSMAYLQHAAERRFLNETAIKVAADNLSSLAEDFGLEVPAEVQKLASLEISPRERLDERRVIYRPPRRERTVKRASGPYEMLKTAQATWHDLPPQEKRAAAVSLFEAEQSLPISIPDHIARYSGDQVGDKLAAHMRVRATLTADPELQQEYGRLAKVASVLGPEATVQTLYRLDNAAGVRWAGGDRYGEHIVDPFLAVYDHTKEAEFSWYHGAENVSAAQLWNFCCAEGSRYTFEKTFADGKWASFCKDPVKAFQGMPLEQQILVSRMARQAE